jgi:argininosuccinate lyase
MKLWQKSYTLDKEIEDYTVGNDYLIDKTLVKYDCIASIAHAKMLAKVKLISEKEANKLIKELNNIIKLNHKNKFKITKSQEDCHTAIEQHLTQKLGNTGKKIHTARSRNDQVLVALRLYYKDNLNKVKELANKFISELKKFSGNHKSTPLPGYTHTRKAMPSSISLWTDALIDSMKDNIVLIDTTLKLIDQNPLGTAAGYGLPIKIDRNLTTNLLSFKKTQMNPIYTQNSRGKFESTLVHTLAQIMFDLNKIATDLILFSMPEFNYFTIPDELCTGSSIMPQKHNPDVLELMRAKYHVVASNQFLLSNITSNLVSGYNRDLQLTKKPVIESLNITKNSLKIATLLFSKLKVNQQECKKAMTKELYATEQVYKLVKKGIPFREAYKQIVKKF